MNVRWLMLIALVSWTATCGQKGPLELPDKGRASFPHSFAFSGAGG